MLFFFGCEVILCFAKGLQCSFLMKLKDCSFDFQVIHMYVFFLSPAQVSLCIGTQTQNWTKALRKAVSIPVLSITIAYEVHWCICHPRRMSSHPSEVQLYVETHRDSNQQGYLWYWILKIIRVYRCCSQNSRKQMLKKLAWGVASISSISINK